MADDEQRLLVSFEARLTKFERDLERGKNRTRRDFGQMKKDAENAGSGIEKAMGNAMKTMGAFSKGLAGGIVGGLAIGGLDAIIGRVTDLTRGVANIGSEAKRAGLSNRTFQELSHVANQARIPVDALVDGMKELSLRADEFIVTGKGSAADAFARLGYSATELKRKLADPNELLIEIIARLQQFDRAAQIRIADELFGGTGGERFVELISQGADGIRRAIKEAHDLGLVLDDEVIQRADEIDRKFSKITGTVGTALKKAVVDVVGAMDDWLDRMNRIEEQTTRNVQSQLLSTYDKLREAKDLLSDLQLDKGINPDDPTIDLNIDRQKQLVEELTGEAMKLRDILDRRNGYSESFIYKTGEEARGAKPPLDNLNATLSGTDTAAGRAVANIKNFGDAIRALKNEVPELAKSLADLDKKAQIEAVYQAAIARAQGQREIALANEMRGKALSSVNLKSATDDPTGYLSSRLASGKAQDHVNGMADAFAAKLAKMLASMPDDLRGSVTINSGYRSIQRQQEIWLDALEKHGSPEAARKWAAPPGNSQHNKGNAADLGYASDAARKWMHQNAGSFGLSFPLSNENWHIEDADARSKNTTAEIQRLTDAATRQADAYSQITANAREYVAAQGTEQQALGMTAQRAQALRYEQEMLNQAQRAGITLTPQQRAQIAQLAQGMAQAEVATEGLRQKQEGLAEAGHFFGSQITDALAGLLSGTMTAEQALQSMLQTLIKVGLQAVLMGEGPLAGLFGGGAGAGSSGGGFGGILGGLLGALFGFAEGGYTGDGGKHEPKGIVHGGEYVVTKEATRRIGTRALDAMNYGRMPGYAEGGLVTGTPMLSTPDLGSMSAAPVQAISINAPVTVNTNGGGTPEQNADLAKRMARQMEVTMRGVVADEMRKQTRPGNFANSRSR
ncbi:MULTISPECIES: D-alanyl-D-alanine carboxypeptidase family protein [unclassified Ensifer]|uniref:D-alanyl-D-alanine carboxypeptidase family protein n=1 Tax=unclassified Ensifer TaxID=2633371 RepID=UPI000813B3D2|nr:MULTISPECIES: D-alanyl-D-alanine carboxypeptidase family protein [unclassified Ensifer]OCP17027.1 phage tail protein [Ensifer sp. LC163]OCP24144.1 phage tail protein [Ensifer sp. LC384]OCP25623.1 phage tail protein [Ensifer sp. LC54]